MESTQQHSAFLSKTQIPRKMRMCQEKERFSYLKGTILERKNIKITQLCDTYPLELLVEGVSWPSNVDVTKREQYLDDDAFYRVFKVTKEDFQKLAKHVKQRLKKEHGLF